MMAAKQTVCVLMLMLSSLPLFLGNPVETESGDPNCQPCGEDCAKCTYGSAVSPACDVKVCLKGPGELCGGKQSTFGICGDGMYCACNRCHGCSTDTLECFSEDCPIP